MSQRPRNDKTLDPMTTLSISLSGLRVLDLSIWRPGPYATSLLVALGADVLKVEPPGGDPMRRFPGLFAAVSAGKRSIELDLKRPADQERARQLADEADVLVEGFRPGVMARLGLDATTARKRNRGLVYCSITGFGQQGARASLPGHDLNYQAWAGSLVPDGGTAITPPLPLADLASGLTAAFGICAAVLSRAASGEGTHLDISMTDVLSTWTGPSGSGTGTNGGGTAVPGYGLFVTADGGQIALGVVDEQHFWSALCNELGLADVSGLDFAARTGRGAELQEAIGDAVARRPRDELVDRLASAGVPASPVLDRAGMLAAQPFPTFPIRLDRAGPPSGVPTLDEHSGQGFLDPT